MDIDLKRKVMSGYLGSMTAGDIYNNIYEIENYNKNTTKDIFLKILNKLFFFEKDMILEFCTDEGDIVLKDFENYPLIRDNIVDDDDYEFIKDIWKNENFKIECEMSNNLINDHGYYYVIYFEIKWYKEMSDKEVQEELNKIEREKELKKEAKLKKKEEKEKEQLRKLQEKYGK